MYFSDDDLASGVWKLWDLDKSNFLKTSRVEVGLMSEKYKGQVKTNTENTFLTELYRHWHASESNACLSC